MSRPKQTHEMLAVLTESGRREVEKFNAEQSRIAELEAKAQSLDKLEEMVKDGWRVYRSQDESNGITIVIAKTLHDGLYGYGPTLIDAILSVSEEAKSAQVCLSCS